MIEVRQADVFKAWLGGLRDGAARARIIARLRRFEIGNIGDFKSVVDGVCEGRVHYGPGYRLYFVRRGEVVIVMLCGGDKRTQTTDIALAKTMAKELAR